MKRHSKKRNLDILLDRVALPIAIFQLKRRMPKKIKKILILKFSGIGDGILSIPAIHQLSKKGYYIGIACSKENEAIFKGLKFIKEIYTSNLEKASKIEFMKFIMKIRKERYDVCIDTSQSSFIFAVSSRLLSKYSIGFRNHKSISRNKFFDKLVPLEENEHMIKNYYRLMEDFGIFKRLKLIPPKNKKKAKIIDNIEKSKGIVGVHATGPLYYKNWPTENYSKVIDSLIKKGYFVILFGGPKEREDNDKIIRLLKVNNRKKIVNLAGKASFEEMFYLMPRLKFFLANDGGPMHVAASFNLPVIGIFGAETPIRYAPYNQKSYSIYKPFRTGPIIKAYRLEWPQKDHPEIPNKITTKEVMEVINLVEKRHL